MNRRPEAPSRVPRELDTWVLAGQSNMQGRAWLRGALQPDRRVWSFTSAGAWEIGGGAAAPALGELHARAPGPHAARDLSGGTGAQRRGARAPRPPGRHQRRRAGNLLRQGHGRRAAPAHRSHTGGARRDVPGRVERIPQGRGQPLRGDAGAHPPGRRTPARRALVPGGIRHGSARGRTELRGTLRSLDRGAARGHGDARLSRSWWYSSAACSRLPRGRDG